MLTYQFQRGVSQAGLTALGSDVDPSTLSGATAVAYQANTNCISDKESGQVQDTVPAQQLAVAVWYAGSGTPTATTVSVYCFNPLLELWVAEAETLNVPITYGVATLIPIPTSRSKRFGAVYAVVVNAAGSPPTGIYTVGLGFDYRTPTNLALKVLGQLISAANPLPVVAELPVPDVVIPQATFSADQAALTTAVAGMRTLSIRVRWTLAASMVLVFERQDTEQMVADGVWDADSVTCENPATFGTTNANASTFMVTGVSGDYTFSVDVGGYVNYRVRAHPWTSGSVLVSANLSAQPNGANVQTQITDASGNGPVTVAKGGVAVSSSGNALTVGIRPGDVLPASAAPADAVANTTTVSMIAAWLGSFNGTTWDRVRSGLTAATSTLTGFLNHLPFGQYNSPSPVLSSGQAIVLQLDQNGNLQANLATQISGEDQTNNRLKTMQGGAYKNLSASGQVKANPGWLVGVVINSCAATATIQLADATSGTTPAITGTWTPGAIVVPTFVPVPAKLVTGLYVTIGVAAANLTVIVGDENG